MGRNAKLRNERRLDNAEDVWVRFGLPYSGPAEAYRSLFEKQDKWALDTWNLWEENYDPKKPKFTIYEEYLGQAKPPRLRLIQAFMFRSFSEAVNTYSATTERFFKRALNHPEKLRLRRLPPPTLVILHDGLPMGDLVAQWCLFREDGIPLAPTGRRSKCLKARDDE